jgi:hypothetical protein
MIYKVKPYKPEIYVSDTQTKKKYYRIGEKIIYDVRLGRLNLGKAKFSHLGMTQLNKRTAHLMTFETDIIRFHDLERIYSDPNSFLPLRVERDISMWPNSEKIIEEYDQEKFTLTINKRKGRHQKQSIIKKNGPTYSAILLPYYIRNIPELQIGWSMDVTLPNQKFKIKLASIEDIEVPAGKFNAYRFESDPRKFEVWISTDDRRIPLKIKGSGNYILLMREYN